MSRDGSDVKSRGCVGERAEWLDWHANAAFQTPVSTSQLSNKKASGFAGGFFAVCPFYWCWASCFCW